MSASNNNAPLATLERDEQNPRVVTITLRREASRNALSIELLEAAHQCVDALAEPAGDQPSVLVFTGEGSAFCAGMDLKQVTADIETPAKLLHSLADLTLKLRSLPMATVARVNGPAIGGGCGLVCVTDFAITFDDNKLGFPEVELGLCPAVVAPWLVRKIGPGRARHLLLAGGIISGADAARLGLVTESASTPAAMDDAVRALTDRLAKAGPRALAATRALLNDLDGSSDEAVVKRGADISAAILSSPEAQDTIRNRFLRPEPSPAR